MAAQQTARDSRSGTRLRARIQRFLGRPGTADLTAYRRQLPRIAAREPQLRRLTDDGLTRAAAAAVDVVEICALGREAARRGLGERPFDVQLLGTLAMLDGRVAEMATGEGKTLSGALTAAGYALRGRSVQVWSVNDYLARRDAEWMRPVYDLLGVSVGSVGQASTAAERRAAYAAQVTYAPVSEAGFDVLRDRLRTDVSDLVTVAPDVVVVDEADSVLVDEAMVPLVLAGAASGADPDRETAELVRRMSLGVHYEVDEEGRTVQLTETGARTAEEALGGIDLYTAEHAETLSRINVALHAHALLARDVDYLVADGRIHLINESRGRVARLQRWPDGLHAAVEAKEGLAGSESGEILDSITVQALVGRYATVCGMTGTAVAVAEELRDFYRLEVAVVPPHRPCVREDEPDRLHVTAQAKEDAILAQVAATHATGRPVLIGTHDVAESERLAARLTRNGLGLQVLNAKNDAAEAAIVAEAGRLGAITVSTQMAGRGTDIRLGGTGGDPGPVAALGGLYVVGTARHPSSRLDQQLRGRAGRQGDPGGSVVFTSVEDVVAQHAPELAWVPADGPDGRITDPVAMRAMDHAQRIAEGVRREIHSNTWRYHTMLGDQRRIVLEHRDRVLRTDDALRDLEVSCADRVEELRSVCERDVLVRVARLIVLWHLDREWSDHLARVADLREGIHLRGLGRGMDPITEFHREIIALFDPLFDRVAERSEETFRAVPVTADGADLEGAGLTRPTATWTYLVQDNLFGNDIERALRGIGRFVRRAVRGDDPTDGD
ncbi:MAG: accessory Sec system translocase SecA2 [Actinomycetales bacterium]|nr:accessory Sec system translocase SecA2 [Actinomycetales bacterium]